MFDHLDDFRRDGGGIRGRCAGGGVHCGVADILRSRDPPCARSVFDCFPLGIGEPNGSLGAFVGPLLREIAIGLR